MITKDQVERLRAKGMRENDAVDLLKRAEGERKRSDPKDFLQPYTKNKFGKNVRNEMFEKVYGDPDKNFVHDNTDNERIKAEMDKEAEYEDHVKERLKTGKSTIFK